MLAIHLLYGFFTCFLYNVISLYDFVSRISINGNIVKKELRKTEKSQIGRVEGAWMISLSFKESRNNQTFAF